MVYPHLREVILSSLFRSQDISLLYRLFLFRILGNYDSGISLVFLKEPHINTETYRQAISAEIELTGNEIADEYIKATNRVLMILARQQIRLAFEQAQKEVDDLHRRTSEGMKTARLSGKQIGRKTGAQVITKKSIAAKACIVKYSKDFHGTLTGFFRKERSLF